MTCTEFIPLLQARYGSGATHIVRIVQFPISKEIGGTRVDTAEKIFRTQESKLKRFKSSMVKDQFCGPNPDADPQ